MDKHAYRDVWEIYSRSWSEPDHANRLKIFARCLRSDCLYTDPRIQVTGYHDLSAYVAEFQNSVPGGKFVITDFSQHHDRSLAHWDMTDPKGTLLSRGISFGLYDDDGKLRQMTGFY